MGDHAVSRSLKQSDEIEVKTGARKIETDLGRGLGKVKRGLLVARWSPLDSLGSFGVGSGFIGDPFQPPIRTIVRETI